MNALVLFLSRLVIGIEIMTSVIALEYLQNAQQVGMISNGLDGPIQLLELNIQRLGQKLAHANQLMHQMENLAHPFLLHFQLFQHHHRLYMLATPQNHLLVARDAPEQQKLDFLRQYRGRKLVLAQQEVNANIQFALLIRNAFKEIVLLNVVGQYYIIVEI